MRRLAIVCLLLLTACGGNASTPTPAGLTIASVMKEFQSHALRATASDAPPPASSPQPTHRTTVTIGFGSSLFLYEFATDTEATDYAQKFGGGLLATLYAHRNIVLSCFKGKEAECQPYYSVLLSLR